MDQIDFGPRVPVRHGRLLTGVLLLASTVAVGVMILRPPEPERPRSYSPPSSPSVSHPLTTDGVDLQLDDVSFAVDSDSRDVSIGMQLTNVAAHDVHVVHARLDGAGFDVLGYAVLRKSLRFDFAQTTVSRRAAPFTIEPRSRVLLVMRYRIDDCNQALNDDSDITVGVAATTDSRTTPHMVDLDLSSITGDAWQKDLVGQDCAEGQTTRDRY